ncbi:MAG: O-phosphoserine--tRNA ligase [bacterium]
MRGKEHPVNSLLAKIREIFLNLSFDEVINPVIVDEKDVFLQYGKEAPLILDRIFYIAGLDRPELGISKEKEGRVRQIIPDFSKWDEIKGFLREYKEGNIEGDDFIEELVKRLDITEKEGIRLVDEVFFELKNLYPISYKKTLRSHMTSAWYSTLSHLIKTKPLPLKLFSQGLRFRREQRQDESHLFESTSSSCVVIEKGFDLEKGKGLCAQILEGIGFKNIEFKTKAVTSNYYEEGTDTEVFAEGIEVANLGFYSLESLANYGIEYPVFNLGFGVDRLAGILNNEQDLRRLLFFQFYKPIFTDKEIAEKLGCEQSPSYGAQISSIIFRKIMEAKDRLGPTEVLCYAGRFLGRDIEISAYNWDSEKPLLSYASLNEIWVNNGEIFGLPKEGVLKGAEDVYKNGINTGLIFLKLITDGFVAKMEREFREGKAELDVKFKIAEHPSDINLSIPKDIMDYITSNNKRVITKGPLFFGIKAE